jgi:hypothetical protein
VNTAQLAAVVQVVLEGVPLPAERSELLTYARRQGAPAEVAIALWSLERRQYGSLDEVGEAIVARQPSCAPEPSRMRDRPTSLTYEQRLVREPAPIGAGVPQSGSPDERPSD